MADPYAVAKKMYPILKNYPYNIVETLDENSPYYLEHFPPEEVGSLENPRPKNLPIGEYGLQIFKDVKPEDIAGTISMLLKPESDFINCSIIYCDGGESRSGTI